MALADYYLCDCCGGKTFYDSNLSYGELRSEMKSNPVTDHVWPDGYVGWMVVLCEECAPEFEVEMRELHAAFQRSSRYGNR